MGTSRFAELPLHPTGIHGTPRDVRPDCGAVELPGRTPAPEPPAPKFVPPARVFVDDFIDGTTAADPWLDGKHQKGLSWVAPEGQTPWRIGTAGDRPCLTAIGRQGRSWMLTAEGDDWADVDVVYEYHNAYNGQGGGVLLRASAATEGYLVDLVGGRIVRRTRGPDGEMVETVLATGEVPVPRAGSGKCRVAIRSHGKEVTITADAEGDGRPELAATDKGPHLIEAGRIGVFTDSPTPWHRTDLTGIRVTVERTQ
jgi:hypothetical protein